MSSKKLLITFLCIFAYSNLSAQPALPDPDSLLSKADSAVSNLETLKYNAKHYTIGVMNVRGKKLMKPVFVGDVSISRLPEDSVFGAKILVNGELVSNRMSNNRSFKFAYDGNQIYKIPLSDEKFYINKPNQTGKQLFLESQDMAYEGFLDPDNFNKELEADSISYAGRGIVGNTPCHIIYTQTNVDSYTKESWLFIGVTDQLPRKILRRFSNTNGQDRIEVSKFTNLKTNVSSSKNLYSLTAPKNYEVSKFRGHFDEPKLIPKGEISPKWTLEDPRGISHSISDYRGKIVILDFWATWCGPCRQQMPQLQKIHEKFSENELAVVGISTWENGNPKHFMEKNNFTYQLLLDGDTVANKYNISGLPTLYVINQNGKIIYSKVGANGSNAEYQKIVEIINNAL
jgi:peroxiredoxin